MVWVMIDLSYLSYRALSSVPDLSHDSFPTGVVVGFLEAMRSICLDPRIASNKVAICCDSKQSYRRQLFPEYKRKRRAEPLEAEEAATRITLHEQVDLLKNHLLPDSGFRVFMQTGCESDDVMAQMAKQLDQGGDVAGVMVTADGDLYQSINHTVHWYDPARNSYLDHLGFWEKKGVSPGEWAEVKALAGCHTDEVPGIPGIGEKSAIEYLHGTYKRSHARYKAIETPEGLAIVERNRKLVTLPHPKTKVVELKDPVYKPEAFYRWCDKLGIKSFKDGGRRRLWDAFFSGSMVEVEGRQTARPRLRRTRPLQEDVDGQMPLFK